jgi:predicted hydrocarbon binding protein
MNEGLTAPRSCAGVLHVVRRWGSRIYPILDERKMEKVYVSEIAVRTTIDSFEDILGINGKNSILTYAGLDRYITDPPGYGEERTLDSTIPARFHTAAHDILGSNGSRALFHRAGRRLISVGIENSPTATAFVEKIRDDSEVYLKAVLDFICYQAAQTGASCTQHPDRFEVNLPRCDVCVGLHEKEPYCHFWKGMLEEVVSHDPRFRYTVRETKCKAMGDESCVFYIERT